MDSIYIKVAICKEMKQLDLINRIIYDYDTFVLRNLKRGMDRKVMNVGWVKAREVEFKSRLGGLCGGIRLVLEYTQQKITDFLELFEKNE